VAPSRGALQAAEVEAMYALHQAQADLGEQIEVIVEEGRQVVVLGLVQTSERKEELTQALRRIALVSAQIQTIEEAAQQAQRATNQPALNETTLGAIESVSTGGQSAAAMNPFQQRLVDYFGGRKGMKDAERREVNRQVTQFYNSVETDASAAMAVAWALRRLQERFASQNAVEFDNVSRQRLEEIEGNHLSLLRQRSRDLQARLRPLLILIVGEGAAETPLIEPTRRTRLLAAFRGAEQVRRLTDQLIAGDTTASLPQTARALLAELTRLEVLLAVLEKK
jgi:hypothetical protein